MIINKITIGYVVQKFDTETRKFVDQTFIGSDERSWENELGDPLNLADDDDAEAVYGKGGVDEPYLNFEMIQP
jgi:hypothetical protein